MFPQCPSKSKSQRFYFLSPHWDYNHGVGALGAWVLKNIPRPSIQLSFKSGFFFFCWSTGCDVRKRRCCHFYNCSNSILSSQKFGFFKGWTLFFSRVWKFHNGGGSWKLGNEIGFCYSSIPTILIWRQGVMKIAILFLDFRFSSCETCSYGYLLSLDVAVDILIFIP